KRLLGAEVIVHVGLGQAGLLGDGRRGGAAVALGREDLLGGGEDQRAVAHPDVPRRGFLFLGVLRLALRQRVRHLLSYGPLSRHRGGIQNLTVWSILIDRLVRSTLQSLTTRTQAAGKERLRRTIGEIAMGNQPDIRAGRLPDSAYAENFGDVHPPLDRKAAL